MFEFIDKFEGLVTIMSLIAFFAMLGVAGMGVALTSFALDGDEGVKEYFKMGGSDL